MQVTDEMLIAAVKKAVELGLIPHVVDQDTYIKNYDRIKDILQAALDASS